MQAALLVALALATQASPQNPLAVANVELSEHFALRWGDDIDFPLALRERVLTRLEDAWAVLVDELGHAPPEGTDQWLLNVYLGSSGANTPEALAYAYASYSAEGYYIVINPIAFDTLEALDGSVAHELFHTIQATSGHYTDGTGGWYWEATAEWAAYLSVPDDPLAGVLMAPIVAMLPHLSIDATNDAAGPEDLSGFHAYAAGIFPIFLTEALGDARLVSDSWRVPTSTADPLQSLDALLADRGRSLPELFVSFAAHVATWDFAQGDLYQAMTDSYAAGYPDQDHRVALVVDALGALGRRPPPELQPERYGFNVIDLAADGPVDVLITPDATGDQGSPSELRATAVIRSGSDRTYVDAAGGDGVLTLTLDPSPGATVKLVVAAVGEGAPGERFGYAVELFEAEEQPGGDAEPEPSETDDDEPGDAAGDAAGEGPRRSSEPPVGCSAAGAEPAWLALLTLLPRLRRRRR